MKRVLRAQSDFKSTTLRNQLTSLVIYEAVTTTAHNAKLLSAYANHFFNKVKVNDLAAKKLVHQTFFDINAVRKTFDEVLPRYDKSATTYVRVLKTTPRHGDNAPMCMVMLIKPLAVAKKEATPKPKVAAKSKESK